MITDYLLSNDIDAVGVGVIDFKKDSFQAKTYVKKQGFVEKDDSIFFDLASLTKVLTNGVLYLNDEKLMSHEDRLLIEHRAGLPSWGLLSRSSWRDELLKFDIKESPTLYSDFSALRFLIEWEKKTKKSPLDVLRKYYSEEMLWWQDLDGSQKTLQNGYIRGEKNFTTVHDPNAANLRCFTSHAGLFATTGGLAQTLLNIEREFSILKKIPREQKGHRFCLGWDTVEESTLAGEGCSSSTFGHLGFTGTSLWIDPVKQVGSIVLTNTTKHFWYNRRNLNSFRKSVGASIWEKF